MPIAADSDSATCQSKSDNILNNSKLQYSPMWTVDFESSIMSAFLRRPLEGGVFPAALV